MKVKIALTIYAAYIKGNRFITYFENAETAMKFLNELYPTEDKHVEPLFILMEDKV